jgi:hypothetical protein
MESMLLSAVPWRARGFVPNLCVLDNVARNDTRKKGNSARGRELRVTPADAIHAPKSGFRASIYLTENRPVIYFLEKRPFTIIYVFA